MDWKPYHTAPRDGSWLYLRGEWTPPDGLKAHWTTDWRDQPVEPGFWETPDRSMAAFDFKEWRPATD